MAETTTTTTATATPTKAATKRLSVKWVKSAIGYNVRQKRTLKALGFSKLGQVIEHTDSPQVRGMINAVKHLVEVK